MTFQKTGDAGVAAVYCSCGQKLDEGVNICPKCKKQLTGEDDDKNIKPAEAKRKGD